MHSRFKHRVEYVVRMHILMQITRCYFLEEVRVNFYNFFYFKYTPFRVITDYCHENINYHGSHNSKVLMWHQVHIRN